MMVYFNQKVKLKKQIWEIADITSHINDCISQLYAFKKIGLKNF